MLFSQLLEKLQKTNSKKQTTKETSTLPIKTENEKKSNQMQPKTKESTNPKKQIKRALNDINKAIQSNNENGELYLEKAEILIQAGKYKQARQTVNQYPKKGDDQELSNRAKNLLHRIQQLQQEISNNKYTTFIEDLRKTAQKYQQKLSNPSNPEGVYPELNVTQFVREEARQARTNELPKLSHELIEKAIDAGYHSPWLLHDKAVSVSMMGRQNEALRLLDELKKESKGEKLLNSIEKKTVELKNGQKQIQLKSKIYLAKQSALMAINYGVKEKFLPESKNISPKTNIKSLVFKQARASLDKIPEATLALCSSILDYAPGDLASLQLKGEALAALKQSDEAIKIWSNLTSSKNAKISQKAAESITGNLTARAQSISSRKSPKAALSFFIQQHFILNLAPSLNREMSKILKKANRFNSESIDSELEKQQLQLMFNTLVIEYLENQWRTQSRLNATGGDQKPGAIRKTASKAG